MEKELKYKKIKRSVMYIDGMEFNKPQTLGERLSVGLIGFFILVTLPLWIWFYLLAKIFETIAKEKKIDQLVHICPKCGADITRIDMGLGSLYLIRCGCGWHGYIDHFDKLTEVKDKG